MTDLLTPSNSLTAFADSNRFLNGRTVSVSRLDSANAVWLCEGSNSTKVILKYFDLSDHGRDHFNSELGVYQGNLNSAWLPNLVTSDANFNLLVLEYIEQRSTPSVSIKQLIQNTSVMMGQLSFDSELHRHVPGIIGLWHDHEARLNSSEAIILEVAKSTMTIFRSVTRLVESWQEIAHLHGDLKLANFLFTEDSFRVIDWESHCMGPACWDSAGILQSVILELLSKGPQSSWATEQVPALHDLLLEGSEDLIDCVIGRLVQSSLEASQMSEKVTVLSANLLQVADFIGRYEFSFLSSL